VDGLGCGADERTGRVRARRVGGRARRGVGERTWGGSVSCVQKVEAGHERVFVCVWVCVCVGVWVCVEKDGRGERGGGQLPFSPSNPLPPSQGVGSERIVRGWVGMRAWGKARDKNAVWGRVGSYRRGRLARVLGRGARLGVWARGQGWSGWQVGVGRVVGKSGQRCRATLPDVSRGLAGMGISRSPVVG